MRLRRCINFFRLLQHPQLPQHFFSLQYSQPVSLPSHPKILILFEHFNPPKPFHPQSYSHSYSTDSSSYHSYSTIFSNSVHCAKIT